MNLSEHLDILSHDVNALAFRTKVDEAVIKRALQGLPITEQDAQRIAKYVGRRMGHDPHSDEDYKIDGLVKVSAPRRHANGQDKHHSSNPVLQRAIDGNRARRF